MSKISNVWGHGDDDDKPVKKLMQQANQITAAQTAQYIPDEYAQLAPPAPHATQYTAPPAPQYATPPAPQYTRQQQVPYAAFAGYAPQYQVPASHVPEPMEPMTIITPTEPLSKPKCRNDDMYIYIIVTLLILIILLLVRAGNELKTLVRLTEFRSNKDIQHMLVNLTRSS